MDLHWLQTKARSWKTPKSFSFLTDMMDSGCFNVCFKDCRSLFRNTGMFSVQGSFKPEFFLYGFCLILFLGHSEALSPFCIFFTEIDSVCLKWELVWRDSSSRSSGSSEHSDSEESQGEYVAYTRQHTSDKLHLDFFMPTRADCRDVFSCQTHYWNGIKDVCLFLSNTFHT